MAERYTVLREFGGGKYKVNQVIACDQALDYDFWNYIQDKRKDGTVKPYIEPKPVYESKVITKISETKDIQIKI